jgi:hypothetical protein
MALPEAKKRQRHEYQPRQAETSLYFFADFPFVSLENISTIVYSAATFLCFKTRSK